MITTTLSQPESQLGNEFAALLASDRPYTRIVFVSAFTALKTILRLRESMLAAANAGAVIRLTVGVDLGGTSREVLEELSQWNCEVFIYHNPIPRATFHPKIYLFERESDSILFLGSNNLTDGGLYTNYEASTRYAFNFPADADEYERLLRPIRSFLEPRGPTVRRLDAQLIETLSVRGILTTEIEARRSRRNRVGQPPADGAVPPNPFSPVAVPRPPLLPSNIRDAITPERPVVTPEDETVVPIGLPRPEGILVWRKVLPPTDALQVRPGSHHVGGVRLTQARFEDTPGHRIDQTTYFRRLFDDYDWETEHGGHADQEHTFVPMRIIILGHDHGTRNFEISHKPSGEAGQDNYTTILRWGRNFNSVIEQANLSNTVFSLYETPNSSAPFFIEITNT
ncbi:MAG: phospholipase D family protein [Victivallales bacterium]|jgi:hypothetical protein